MILHPAVIALLLSSALISAMVLYASYFGFRIISKWDLNSGSELQLGLERRTYLVSTILSYVFFFELISFFLFIYTADNLCNLFVGAMCAAGTLNVNDYGYPALILKIVNFILAGVWLIMNYADNRAYDYPLIKTKYLLLLMIAPVMLSEAVVQGNYFIGLRADVITSCCGALFSTDIRGLTSEISALPAKPMKAAFFTGMSLTLVSGIYFYLKGYKDKISGYLFSILSGSSFVISILSIISFISLYIYELPTHHCPFCILQKEYNYIGYPLYLALLAGGVSGMGIGALMPFRNIESLRETLPSIQRRLAIITLLSYLVFSAIVISKIVFSDFRLE
jgi:positive regulator of sigma E activity